MISVRRFAIYRRRKFVVILTVGRTGSTLLQGVVNALPGFMIRGENNNFIYGLYCAYASLQLSQDHLDTQAAKDAWYGADLHNVDAFASDSARIFVRQLLGDNYEDKYKAIGFKEIRWMYLEKPYDSLSEFLRFIEKMFPKTHFILLTRDIDQIMKSGWWPTVDGPAVRRLILDFFQLARTIPVSNLFELDYSHLHPGSQKVRELCTFLGERYLPSMDDVFQIKHSS